MSTSTDAYLYFGFDFFDTEGTGRGPFDDHDGEWEFAYATAVGIHDDSGYIVNGNYAHPRGAERDAAQKRYFAYRDRVRAAARESGCSIGAHCMGEAPIYYVYVTPHHHSAWRGKSVEVDPARLVVTPEEIQKLRSFCEVMGIEWQEPQWRLASYWG